MRGRRGHARPCRALVDDVSARCRGGEGAGVACLLVGALLLPLAQRLHMPFAAVGFASVVALIPGVFLFRMSSGLVALQNDAASASSSLIGETFSDGMTAVRIALAMILGLTQPKRFYEPVGFRVRGRS